MIKPNYDRGLGKKAGDGRHVGYCCTCGADTFDGIRHRCPQKISEKTFAVVVAAKEYMWARRDVNASTAGGFMLEKNRRLAEAKFAALEAAIAALEKDATVTDPEMFPLSGHGVSPA